MTASPDYAGLRQYREARSTGTHVMVLDVREAGYDEADGGRWMTLCEDHGNNVQHLTLADARGFASTPEQWCEACMVESADRDLGLAR